MTNISRLLPEGEELKLFSRKKGQRASLSLDLIPTQKTKLNAKWELSFGGGRQPTGSRCRDVNSGPRHVPPESSSLFDNLDLFASETIHNASLFATKSLIQLTFLSDSYQIITLCPSLPHTICISDLHFHCKFNLHKIAYKLQIIAIAFNILLFSLLFRLNNRPFLYRIDICIISTSLS